MIKVIRDGDQYIMMLVSKPVGQMSAHGQTVSMSKLLPELQGLGLGKKMYGEVMRRQPQRLLHSDATVSSEAQRVWEGMKNRKGYSVAQSPMARPISEKPVQGIRSGISAYNANAQTIDDVLGNIRTLHRKKTDPKIIDAMYNELDRIPHSYSAYTASLPPAAGLPALQNTPKELLPDIPHVLRGI